MNEWQCNHPLGCHMVAYGVGGAIGLRAIGWQFEPGTIRPVFRYARALCPAHRTDLKPIDCRYNHPASSPCMMCAAEAEAERVFPAQLEGRFVKQGGAPVTPVTEDPAACH